MTTLLLKLSVFIATALIAGRPAQAQTTAPTPAPTPAVSAVPSIEASKPPGNDLPFMKAFPNLNEYVFHEPKSGFYLGLGVSPFALVKDRTEFGANFFQIHYLSDRWDIEILNVGYSVTHGQSATYQSNNFTFRSAAKLRIGSIISVGPMVGWEYVSFPNLGATLLKIPYQSPDEPFSSNGVIYGAILSETIRFHETYLIQVNEVMYKETYSNVSTPEGWNYYFDKTDVQANPSLIGPGVVSMIEVSFLF